jgi:hypothetical protein
VLALEAPSLEPHPPPDDPRDAHLRDVVVRLKPHFFLPPFGFGFFGPCSMLVVLRSVVSKTGMEELYPNGGYRPGPV